MLPDIASSPWPAELPLPEGWLVYDLVYKPPETTFLRHARAAGLPAANGMGMLVEQAALALERWTGQPVPRQAMWEVIGNIKDEVFHETCARMAHLSPHFFATLSARLQVLQAEGRDIIRLDEGSPDLPPARHILETLVQAAPLASDTHSYQPHRGPNALREAWAGLYRRQYGVELDPETRDHPPARLEGGHFSPEPGLLEPGDLALVPDPGYVTYTRGALFAGAQVYRLPLLPERGYLPDLEAMPGSRYCARPS